MGFGWQDKTGVQLLWLGWSPGELDLHPKDSEKLGGWEMREDVGGIGILERSQ